MASVADAVAWYTSQGRLHAAADRDDALQQAVRRLGGRRGGRARHRPVRLAAGQRRRPQPAGPGVDGKPPAGCPDRSWSAPAAVTTGPATTSSPSPPAPTAGWSPPSGPSSPPSIWPNRRLTLRTDDGQHVQLGKDEAGSDRLDYGYATTVHRSQGSTTERAHLFADGGGRELAYVAMSRARQSTHVWTVADDLPQAVDDLRRDWSTRRTPTWAIDTGLPDRATLTRERFQALPPDQQARFAALLHAETAIAGHAIAGIRLPDRAATLGQAEAALANAQQARKDLETGTRCLADHRGGSGGP